MFCMFIFIHSFVLLQLYECTRMTKFENESQTQKRANVSSNICSCKYNHGNYLVCLIESFSDVFVRETAHALTTL